MNDFQKIYDDLWAKIEPVLLAADPPKATGRRRVDQRRLLDGVIYKFRSGCQWNRLPKELGDDSTVHRAFQRWVRLGVFDQVWAMIEEDEELGNKTGKITGSAGLSEGLNTGQDSRISGFENCQDFPGLFLH